MELELGLEPLDMSEFNADLIDENKIASVRQSSQ